MYQKEPSFRTWDKITYISKEYCIPLPVDINCGYSQALCKVLDHMSIHGSPQAIEVRTAPTHYTSSLQICEVRLRYLNGRDAVFSYTDYYVNPQVNMAAPTVMLKTEEKAKEEKKTDNKLLLLL